MPACWAVNPIVQVDGVNMPLVATLLNSEGRQRFYHASAIYPERGMTWCLSYVTTMEADFSGLDAISSVVRIFDEVLDDEPNGDNPSRSRMQTWMKDRHQSNSGRLRTKLSSAGANKDGIGTTTTREEIIKRLGFVSSALLDADFNPVAWYTPGTRTRP